MATIILTYNVTNQNNSVYIFMQVKLLIKALSPARCQASGLTSANLYQVFLKE